MRKVYSVFQRLLLISMLFTPLIVSAQSATLSGDLKDSNGEALIGATILLDGTTTGTVTDIDGNYVIGGITPGTYNVVYSFVGYKTITESITFSAGENVRRSFVLIEDVNVLDEAIVIGYGTTQSRDLTGSVTAVTTKDFAKGNISTPEQLVQGKIAGVKITSNSGMPGAGSQIRIRGGSSLNASNDPLIVIDGVPVDNGSINGASNPLSLINPDDIESITVLKDASAAAIYGSRAANGVILITTKKGKSSDALKVDFSTNNGVAQVTGYVGVLSGDEFRALVNEKGSTSQKDKLGTENTEWQKEIYQLGFNTDNNLSFTGGVKGLPYRLGLEYYHETGILKTSQLDRIGLTLNLNPSLLNDQLKIDANAKLYNNNNVFADQGAIGSAVTFDPSHPVYSGVDEYGGYYEWLDPVTGDPNQLAPRNPLGLLEQREDKSTVNRFIGNVLFDYAIPFLPELHGFLNLGTDISRSNGTVFVPAEAASAFLRGGVDNVYEQSKDNQLLELYFNYGKELRSIQSRFDLTGGYSYQYWSTESPAQPDLNVDGDTITPAGIPFATDNALISFYGRLNYTFQEKYLLTATLRDDGSSRFSPDTRWGLFPSVAFAWRISEENFLKNSENLSFLKLRLGWGVTGQQDILGNDYPYIANYAEGTSTAQYQFGDEFYYVLRPDGYDPNIKWEETTTMNAGLDFGFNNNRINGAIDFYKKTTEDLLSVIPVPAGTNFTNQLLTNVGSMENTGMELTLGYIAVDNERMYLDFGFNGTFNKNEITKLTVVPDTTSEGILVGGISGGVGSTIQIHSVGYPTYTFYTYEQVYENGKPLEGEYVDQNNDGKINADDLVRFDGNPAPDFYLGLYSNLSYDKWTAGFSLRGEFGGYVYNNVNSNLGNYFNVGSSKGYLANVVDNYTETEFKNPQYFSDYYVEKANFIRLDNIYLGYNFGNIFNDQVGFRATAIVQNVFVISNYSGLDPEVSSGIDNNFYPRPRTYSVNFSFNF
ncbi:MAG: SusC/RagA family TonB-linked outer membrane protein [Chitinophagales bacterium]